VGRKPGFGDAGWQCFRRATIANIFRARRLSRSLAALARTALRIVGMRRRRLTKRPPRARLGAKCGRREWVCGTAFGRVAWQAGPLRRRLRSLRSSRRRMKSGRASGLPDRSGALRRRRRSPASPSRRPITTPRRRPAARSRAPA
jgi:hypothetical protein